MMEVINVITIFEFVFAGLGVLYYLSVLVVLAFVIDADESDPDMKPSKNSAVAALLTIIVIISGILIILNVLLAFLLHRGVKNRDLKQINKWFTAQCVILGFILMRTFGKMFSDPSIILKSGTLMAYRVWTLYVVTKFAKKLKEEGPEDSGASAHFQPMTQE